ncbi:MAG: carbohydrate kinase family protein [Candidatus Shapirobacteria bacterium]
MLDVISIGAATVDIFVKSRDFLVKDNYLSLPLSSKNEISEGLICSGGGATNSSVAFSRLGLKSACLSLIGEDLLSQYIYQDLRQNQVDSSLIISQPNDTTDYSVILVTSDGSRTILTNRGPTHLESRHFNWELLKNTHWFYTSSLEGNLDLLEQLIGFALENNIKIALNPGNRELKQKARLLPLLPHLDFFLLNQTEAEDFSGLSASDPQFWPKISSSGAKICAVTNGRQGAHVFIQDQKYYSPILNVIPIDETGAGDSFGSGFVAGLIHGLKPEDALFWGIKNSASVVSRLGAKPGLLTLNQIRS